jgi:hypothetical protein
LIFFHPLISIYVLFILMGFFIAVSVEKIFLYQRLSTNKFFYLPLTIGTVFLFWMEKQVAFYGSIVRTITAFTVTATQDTSKSLIDKQLVVVSTSGASFLLILDRFIKSYGILTIYSIFGCIFITICIYNIFNKKIKRIDFFLFIQTLIALIISFIMLSGYFIIGEIHRSIFLWILLIPLFCGIIMSKILLRFKEFKFQKIISGIFIFLIFVCIVLGIFALYPSPWSSSVNRITSYQDKEGVVWFVKNYDPAIPAIYNLVEINKWPSYVLGIESKNVMTYGELPSHFGYTTNINIGQFYNGKKMYLLTNERLRKWHLSVPEERQSRLKQYLDNDFIRLESDNTVNHIFDSNEFECWIIN